MSETIKCERWCSDFCFNLCAYRGFGCAYEHKYPRKAKTGTRKTTENEVRLNGE